VGGVAAGREGSVMAVLEPTGSDEEQDRQALSTSEAGGSTREDRRVESGNKGEGLQIDGPGPCFGTSRPVRVEGPAQGSTRQTSSRWACRHG